MTGKELYEGRWFHRNPDRDWAFTRLDKISDNQAAFITKLCERDGTCNEGGCGIDFGGWSAWNSIVTALKRKGVLKAEGGKLILIEGEPAPYVEPMLPKPYMKIQRVLLDVFDGEQVSVQNQWIWLDPRGDMEFLVILPLEMAQVLLDRSERTTIAAGFFVLAARWRRRQFTEPRRSRMSSWRLALACVGRCSLSSLRRLLKIQMISITRKMV